MFLSSFQKILRVSYLRPTSSIVLSLKRCPNSTFPSPLRTTPAEQSFYPFLCRSKPTSFPGMLSTPSAAYGVTPVSKKPFAEAANSSSTTRRYTTSTRWRGWAVRVTCLQIKTFWGREWRRRVLPKLRSRLESWHISCLMWVGRGVRGRNGFIVLRT